MPPSQQEREAQAELAAALAVYEQAVMAERAAKEAHDLAKSEANRASCALSNAQTRTDSAWKKLENLRNAARGVR